MPNLAAPASIVVHVRYWHKADIEGLSPNVRFRG